MSESINSCKIVIPFVFMPYTSYVCILFDVGISVVTIYIGHHHIHYCIKC